MKSDRNAGSDRSKKNAPPAKPASWRQGKTGSAAVGSYWKQRYRNPAEGYATTRRLKLAGLAGASLLLLAALVLVLLYFPRPLTMMAVAVTDLEGPLPVNALTGEDILRMQETIGTHKNFRLHEPLKPVGDAQSFLQDFKNQLSELRPKGPVVWRTKAVVIYLSAHGVVDENGNACFITSRGDPLNASTWLRATDVLTAIKDSPNIASTNKLLLVDAGRMRECWPLGVFHNTFADRLADAVYEVNDPRLYVINSTRDDQRGWHAPELNGSSFGYFVAQGLAGAANDAGHSFWSFRQRPVTLQELYAYLQQRVDNFARQYRDASQQPRLLTAGPEDADFPLAYATDQSFPEPQPLDLSDRPAEVARLWDDLAALREQDVVRFAPHLWAETESRLMRLESLIAAGRVYDDQYLSSRDQLRQLLAQLAMARDALSKHQATVARAKQQISPAELGDARRQFEEWIAAVAQPDAEKPVPTPRIPYQAAATIAWESIAGTKQAENSAIGPQDIERALDLVNQSPTAPDVEPAEIHFARILLSNLAWDTAGAAVSDALRTQRIAEEVAAPWDIRGHYWAKSRLETADRDLRTARDQLFIGTERQLQEAATAWSSLGSVGGEYAQAEQTIHSASEALRVRDQSLASSLHFAKWIMTHPHLENRKSLADALQSLIQKTHELSRQIDSVPSGETQLRSQQQRLNETRESVASHLADLQEAFDRCCDNLYIMSTYDQRSLAQIASLLSTPIIPKRSAADGSHIRNVLRERFVQQRWQQSRNLERLTDVVANPSTNDDYLSCLEGRLHPALELFNDADFRAASTAAITGRDAISRSGASDEERQQASLTQLEESGGRLRSWLSQLNQTGDKLKQLTDKQLETATTSQRPCDVRLGLSKADRLFRASASLIADQELERDYVRDLWRLDQQFFTLWHGERALRDFWGPTVAGEESYFARSARSHAQEAMRLYEPARAYHEELFDATEQAARAVAEWSPLVAMDLRVARDESLARHRMEFRSLPESVIRRLNFDTARAAISVAEFDGQSFPWLDRETQRPLQRRPMRIVPAGGGTTDLAHTFRNDGRLREAGILQGVTFFRGHRLSNSFRVSTGPTAAMVFQRPDPPRTTVRVRGDKTQKSKIVFVLDCSGSMTKRFAKAQRVLRAIVSRLDADSYEIGLFAYGHRAGWVEVSRNPRRYEVDLAPNAPANLKPGNDVELLYPLDDIKRRDPTTGVVRDIRPEFLAVIDELEPRGETPLYYACVLAAREFSGNQDGQRHVVVITDGVNKSDNPTPWTAVRDRFVAGGIRLELMGFQIVPETAEDRQAYAELTDRLAPSSELITFRNTNQVGELQQAIEEALRLREFELVGDGKRVAPGPLDLGGTWKRTKAEFQSGPYAIQIVDNPNAQLDVTLDGGEALDIYYRDGELMHRRFDFELEKSIRAGAFESAKFFVGIHTPKNDNGLLSFDISVQNANPQSFSPRPQHAWAIIRPIINGEVVQDAVYYGHECEFVSERPVPVLRYRVSGWPEKAYEAEVIVNYTLDRYAGNKQSALLDLSQPNQIDDLVEDVTFFVEPRPAEGDGFFRIAIREDHSQGQSFRPVRLQLVPSASRVRHVADVKDRSVRHVFSVEPAEIERREARLLVTTPDDMRDWVEAGPIRVEVPIR